MGWKNLPCGYHHLSKCLPFSFITFITVRWKIHDVGTTTHHVLISSMLALRLRLFLLSSTFFHLRPSALLEKTEQHRQLQTALGSSFQFRFWHRLRQWTQLAELFLQQLSKWFFFDYNEKISPPGSSSNFVRIITGFLVHLTHVLLLGPSGHRLCLGPSGRSTPSRFVWPSSPLLARLAFIHISTRMARLSLGLPSSSTWALIPFDGNKREIPHTQLNSLLLLIFSQTNTNRILTHLQAHTIFCGGGRPP